MKTKPHPRTRPAKMGRAKHDAPKEIWLQWNGDQEPDNSIEPQEATWAQHQVFPHDVRYVRARDRATQEAMVERGAKALYDMKDWPLKRTWNKTLLKENYRECARAVLAAVGLVDKE